MQTLLVILVVLYMIASVVDSIRTDTDGLALYLTILVWIGSFMTGVMLTAQGIHYLISNA